MKKKLSIAVFGERFEIYLEEEFFEVVKDDLEKLQNPTPKELLHLFLSTKKEIYEINKKLEIILAKLEKK